MESLVSGLVLPFRTISVLDMNPDAASTSIPSGISTSPDPDTLKWVLFQLCKGIVLIINHYKRWDYSTATMVPPSDQTAQAQLSSHEPSTYYKGTRGNRQITDLSVSVVTVNVLEK